MTDAVTSRGGTRRRGARGLLFALQVLVVLLALAVPLAIVLHIQAGRNLGLQQDPGPGAPPVSNVSLQSSATAGSDQLVVLRYRDIAPSSDHANAVTPQAFADQMRLLVSLGYRSATVADVQTAVRNEGIAGRRVLITFDGGSKGMWTYADPVLARYHLHAVAFVPPALVGTHQPHYVTWPELAAMRRSGRWDVQTQVENPDRVVTDQTSAERTLLAHGLPQPSLVSYSQQPTTATDGVFPVSAHAVVSAAVVAAAPPRPVGESDLHDRLLPAISITGADTVQSLTSTLRAVAPLSPGDADLSAAARWTTERHVRNLTIGSDGRYEIHGRSTQGWRFSGYAVGRSDHWSDYVLSATVQGLQSHNRAGGLVVRSSGQAGQRVVITADQVQVQNLSETGRAYGIYTADLAGADAHQVRIDVRRSSTEVVVDGTARVTVAAAPVSQGGIALMSYLGSGGTGAWFVRVGVHPLS